MHKRLTRLLICATIYSALFASPAQAETGYGWQEFVDQGDLQLKLQRLPQAEECYRQALKITRQSKPTNIDDIVTCQNKLAKILTIEDINEESIPLYKKSLKQLQKAHGKNSPLLIATLIALGKVQEMDGEYLKAIKLYQRAVDIDALDSKSDSARQALCLHNLGLASYKANLIQQAEDCYRKALTLTLAQRALSDTSELVSLLSDYLDLRQHYTGPSKIMVSQFQTELLKDQVQALASTRAVAPSSFESQVSLSFKPQPGAAPVVIPEQNGDNALIDEIARQNARDKGNSTDQLNSSGIDYMERMVAIDIKTLGPNHPSVARDLKGLASVYVNQGRYEQAQPLLERALAIHVAIYGNKSVAAQRLSTLLDLLKQARQSADIAPTLIGELASKNTVPLAAQTLEIAQRLNELAFASYCQGKLEDASAFYAYALDSTLHATGERSLFTAATLKDYERVLRSLGQTSQAEKYNTISRSITTEALAVKLLRVQ